MFCQYQRTLVSELATHVKALQLTRKARGLYRVGCHQQDIGAAISGVVVANVDHAGCE